MCDLEYPDWMITEDVRSPYYDESSDDLYYKTSEELESELDDIVETLLESESYLYRARLFSRMEDIQDRLRQI
jgi:hypothetical protein